MEEKFLLEFTERLVEICTTFSRLGTLDALQEELRSSFKVNNQPEQSHTECGTKPVGSLSGITDWIRSSRLIRNKVDEILEQPQHEYDHAVMRFYEALRLVPLSKRPQTAALLGDQGRHALWPYYWRAGWLAVEEQSQGRLLSGLSIYALREPDRGDQRDKLCELAMGHVYAQVLGCNPEALFNEAATFASPSVSELMKQFGKRKDVTAGAFGWRRIETPHGPRFRQNI